MVIIKSIEPNYLISKEKEIASYTVAFQVVNKTASSGDTITLNGNIVIQSEKPVIDLSTINNRIISSVTSLFKSEIQKYAYPDTEADGYVYCGKCGKLK